MACIFTIEMSCLLTFLLFYPTVKLMVHELMHPHVTESAPKDFIPHVFDFSLVLMFSFL